MAGSARRCAFLTMDSIEGRCIDADLAIPPLELRHWTVDWVPWRSPGVHWNDYDAVYIGVPWDYPEDLQGFLALLEQIDGSRAVLVNDIALVRWSVSKTYLRDLERRGADIVPSYWQDRLQAGDLEGFFDRFDARPLIIKPTVSTNSTDTFLLTRDTTDEDVLLRTFRDRPFVVQRFIDSIRTEGEFSLFYFSAGFSHAIAKLPRERDFRAQEEYGADIRVIEPEPALMESADRVLALVRPTPVYARIDFVRAADGRFLLMEVELIEPSLYLRMHPSAPERFAAAFDRYARSRARGTGDRNPS